MLKKLTYAQIRALEWLTGEWKTDPGPVSQATQSLSLQPGRYVQDECGPFGKRGGWKIRYRLTPSGLALKAELEADLIACGVRGQRGQV